MNANIFLQVNCSLVRAHPELLINCTYHISAPLSITDLVLMSVLAVVDVTIRSL